MREYKRNRKKVEIEKGRIIKETAGRELGKGEKL